jgi:phosphotransferase family enzyme
MVTTAVRRPPSLPADRDLPGAADLLASAGAERVARFLDGRGLEPHRVEPAQAHYRPGRWLAVCFRTAAVDKASGRPVCPTVTVELRAGEPEAVWAFPDDPALPGLVVAVDGRHVRRRLRPRPTDVVVDRLRYRPRRRAVLRYRLLGSSGDSVLFGKVLAPRRGRRLLALADALRATGGGPLRLGLPAGRVGPGVLVVPPVPGRALRDLLLGGRRLPSPERLAGLPEALHSRCGPSIGASGPADERGTSRRRVDPATALCAARVVARLLPAEGCTAGRVAEAVIGCAEESEPPEEWIVHGDLYENQVLVDGDTLGLIDLDDLGPGDPLLDVANFSAHLLVLGASGPPAGHVILRYRDELRAAFCRRLDADPAALAWREAYCLLRLASGPFRVLHPDWSRRMGDRLALAARALAVR